MKLEHVSAMCPNSGFAVQLEGFSGGFNTVLGANGTGKTSACSIVRDTFCPPDPLLPQPDPLMGSVRVSDGLSQLILRPVRTRIQDHPDITASIGTPSEEFRQAIIRMNRPVFRQLYFAGSSEESGLHRLLQSAQADGLPLDTHFPAGTAERDELVRRLCSNFVPDDLQNAERQHQQLLQDLQRTETEQNQRLLQLKRLLDERTREREACQTQLARLREELEHLERDDQPIYMQPVPVTPVVTTQSCEQSERIVSKWLETLSDLDAHLQKLQHLETSLQDLRIAEAALRRQLSQSPATVPERVLSAERDMVGSIESLMRRTPQTTDRCAHCGDIHQHEHSLHWTTVRSDLQTMLGQLRSVTSEHCAGLCQCDLHAELDEVSKSSISLQAWRDRLARRRDLLVTRLKDQGLTAYFEDTHTQRLCGCARHAAVLQEIRCRTNRALNQNYASVATLVEPVPLAPVIDTAAMSRRNARRQELLNLIAGHEAARLRLLADIEELNRQIQVVNQSEQLSRLRVELKAHQSKLEQLRQSQTQLCSPQEVIQRLTQMSAQGQLSPILAEASMKLCQITEGQYRVLRIQPETGELEVLTANATWRPWSQLSAGTQRLISILVRLPMIREYGRRGVQFPLMLDDVLSDNDLEWQSAAVDLLGDFAREGHQVIFLTCHQHLADLCQTQSTQVRVLVRKPTTRPSASVTPPVNVLETIRTQIPVVTKPVIDTVKPALDSQTLRVPAPMLVRVPTPARIVSQPAVSQPVGQDYWLSLNDPISSVPAIGRQKVRRLRHLGVRNVHDLLNMPLDWNRIYRGLGVNPSCVEQWQSKARLLSTVAGLTPLEADQLASCGIRDAEGLQQIRPDELASRLRWYRSSAQQPATETWDQQRLQGILQHARQPRRLDADSSSFRHTSRSKRRRMSRFLPRNAYSTYRQRNRSGDATAMARTPDPITTITTPLTSDSTTRWPRTPRTRTKTPVNDNSPRFRLSRMSAVVDAPSIGPKTASRLRRVKIKSVADLLNCDPQAIASQLDDNYIKADTIRSWQNQAKLMCCIPEIHGHDAQLLVACGVDNPQRLMNHNPQELHQLVSELARTTQGKRILRSGKHPDLEEISFWINSARQSRSLDAA